MSVFWLNEVLVYYCLRERVPGFLDSEVETEIEKVREHYIFYILIILYFFLYSYILLPAGESTDD